MQGVIKAKAEKSGHKWRTIQRAKDDLGVISFKQRFDGQWEWKLPEVDPAVSFPQDSHIPPELYEAATTACSGLKITAGEFISQLETGEHAEIISNPAVARSTAQSMDARK
jgi:hypothetical protein